MHDWTGLGNLFIGVIQVLLLVFVIGAIVAGFFSLVYFALNGEVVSLLSFARMTGGVSALVGFVLLISHMG